MTDFTEALKRANENLPTITLEHKDKRGRIQKQQYVMVKDRLAAFRREFPGWTINTAFVDLEEDYAVMKTYIEDPEGRTIATGHAREAKEDGPINRSGSWLENAETSSVGRALANLGIGIDDSYASADEVAAALNRQEEQQEEDLGKYIDKRSFNRLVELCKLHGKDMAWMLATAEAASGSTITPEGYTKIVKTLDGQANG